MRVSRPLTLTALGILGLALRAPAQVIEAEGWQSAGPSFDDVTSISIATDEAESLYAAATNPSTTASGIFKSTDAGHSWRLLLAASPGETADAVRVDPRAPGRVFATTIRPAGETSYSTRIYRSDDAGATWTAVADLEGRGGSFVFDTAAAFRVYFATGAGPLYASEDTGVTWVERSSETRFLVVAGPDGWLYAAGPDGAILRSSDAGYTWVALPDLPPCVLVPTPVDTLAFDALGRLYVGTGQLRTILVLCGALLRWNGNTGWELVAPFFARSLAFDSGDPSRAYAVSLGPGFTQVWETRDGGAGWRASNTIGEFDPTELALSASGRSLYAASPTGLYRLGIRKPRALERR